jgi:hypothetical protein
MGRVAFPKTVLMQGIDLTCSEVLGEVDLSDADIRGGILGERAKIGGELRLTRAMVDGDIQMRGAEIDDRLEMSGARASLLAIAEGDIHRDVDLAHTVLIVVNFSGAKIGGAMKIQDALILRSFIANGASFGRGFSLESARVCGVMDLSEAGGPPATGVAAGGDAGDPPLTPGVFSISDLTVDGQLMVPLAGGSALTMAGVTVAQGFVLLDGTFGDSSLTGIRVTGGDCSLDGAQFLGKLLIGESDFGKRFSATEALFKGDVEFRRVRFPGDDPMQGATFARAPTLTETTLPKPPTVKDEQDEEQAPDEGDDDDSDGQ